jgi:hypothetical protein
MTIAKSTIRKMLLSFAITFPMFAIVVYASWRRTPGSWRVFLATLILAPLMLALLPLITDLGEQIRARKAAQRALWREDYKNSPEANALNLHE